MVNLCFEEKEERKKERGKRGKDLYSKEREEYYNGNGWGIEAIEELRKEERDIESLLIKRELDIQKQIEEDKGIKVGKYIGI